MSDTLKRTPNEIEELKKLIADTIEKNVVDMGTVLQTNPKLQVQQDMWNQAREKSPGLRMVFGLEVSIFSHTMLEVFLDWLHGDDELMTEEGVNLGEISKRVDEVAGRVRARIELGLDAAGKKRIVH